MTDAERRAREEHDRRRADDLDDGKWNLGACPKTPLDSTGCEARWLCRRSSETGSARLNRRGFAPAGLSLGLGPDEGFLDRLL